MAAKKDAGKKAKRDASDKDLGASNQVKQGPPVERGDLCMSFPRIRVSPENDEQGIWFRWRLSAIETDQVAEDEHSATLDGEGVPRKPVIESAGCTEIIECTSGDFGFEASLRGIPLSAEFANAALDAGDGYEIVIEAYRGEYGNAEEDELVGKSSVSLVPLVCDARQALEIDLRLCESSEDGEAKGDDALASLALGLRLEAVGKLRDFWTAGCVASCDHLELRNVPTEWETHLDATGLDESTQATFNIGESTLLRGSLSKTVPPQAASDHAQEEEEEGKQHVDGNEKSQDEEKNSSSGTESIKDDADTAIWSIDRREANKLVFLPPDEVKALREEGHALLSLSLAGEPAEGALLGLLGVGSADIAALLQIDVHQSPLAAELTIESVPTPQDVDQDEAATDAAEISESDAENKHPNVTCFVEASVRMTRALVESPPPAQPELASVRELVEGRPPRRMRAPSALEMLDEAAEEIVNRVTKVFSETNGAKEQERVNVLHNLNVNGHYQAMRAALKDGLSKFVTSEKRGEFNGLEGDVLYSAVFERALALLNQTFNDKVEAAKRGQISLKAKPTPARRLADLQERLFRLLAQAQDLEAAGLFEEAEEVHQERVGDAEKTALLDNEQDLPVDPAVWFEYASFCLRRGESRRAVAAECLRSALALDDDHIPSLVAYGALLMDSGSDTQAETFLARAAAQDSPHASDVRGRRDFATAHGLLQAMTERRTASQPPASFAAAGLEWAGMDDDDAKARAALCSHACAQCLAWKLERVATRLLDVRKTALVAARERLTSEEETLALFAGKMLEGWLRGDKRQLEDAIEAHDGSAASFILLARYMVSTAPMNPGNETAQENVADEAPEDVDATEESHALRRLALEQAFAKLEDSDSHEVSAEALSNVWCVDVDEAIVRAAVLELGKIYLAARAPGAAKRVFLFACAKWPSPAAWAGAGEACILGQAFTDAVDLLAEANLMDRVSPRIWGLLVLACLHAGMTDLAQRSFVHAKGLTDADLWHRLGCRFLELGDLDRAAESFYAQKALGVAQGPELARVLVLQNKFEEASSLLDTLSDPGMEAKDGQVADLRDLLRKLVVQGSQ